MQWISPDKSSVEPEKKWVARKRKVFEGLGRKVLHTVRTTFFQTPL